MIVWRLVAVYKLGGESEIQSGGDDVTRGCKHVDSKLQLSPIRGMVASCASLSAGQNPQPSDGSPAFLLPSIQSYQSTFSALHFLDLGEWHRNTLGRFQWRSLAQLSL